MRKNTETLTFFDPAKCILGLISCLATVVILGLVVLSFFHPWVWIGVAIIGLLLAEIGEWWIFPHWLWTSYKRIVISTQTDSVTFVTGFWPLVTRQSRPMGEIEALVITTTTVGVIGPAHRFNLAVVERGGKERSFFRGFRGEITVRRRAHKAAEILRCEMRDGTYSPPLVSLAGLPGVEMGLDDTPPRGVRERLQENGEYRVEWSRRHEWLAYAVLLGIISGIYGAAILLKWAKPTEPGGWEVFLGLLAATCIALALRAVLPRRILAVTNESVVYRLEVLGIRIHGRTLPTEGISRVSYEGMRTTGPYGGVAPAKLVIIAQDEVLRISDCGGVIGPFLESQLTRLIPALCGNDRSPAQPPSLSLP